MRTKSPRKHAASKRPLRKLVAGLIAASTAITAFLVPISASAADLYTHIDENFNRTGFASFSAGPDYVRAVGTLEFREYNANNRRFSVSIEGSADVATHKAVLRAYKPANATGSYSNWASSNTRSPAHDFVLDTSFGSGGVLEILNPSGTAITGVTSVIQQSQRLISNPTLATGNDQTSLDSNLVPSLLVVTASSSFVIRLDHTTLAPGGLGVCTTSCKQHALDVTAAIAGVAGAGATPSGFASIQSPDNSSDSFLWAPTDPNGENFSEAYVSGVKADGKIFIAKLHMGVFVRSAEVFNNDLRFSTYVSGKFAPGEQVSVFGVNPVEYNVSAVNMTSASGFGFEFAKTATPPNYVSGGIAIRSNGLGRSAGDLSDYTEIPASEFATGSYAGFTTFTPIENGLVVGAFTNVLHIAGNISNGTKTVGVVIRRAMTEGLELRPHETQPLTYIDVGTASTQLGFWSGTSTSAVLGGSYTDTGNVARPIMVSSTEGTTMFSSFISHKLEVDSAAGERLLAARAGAIALASDGEGLRVYTWAGTPTVSNTAPSTTSRQTFGPTGTAPSSAVISTPLVNSFDSMISFTGFSKTAGATIVAAQFQSRLPRWLTAPTLALPGSQLTLSPSGSSQLLGFDTVNSFYSCSAAFSGSSLTVSTPTTPSGCTAISGLSIFSDGRVDITKDENPSLLAGHVIRKISHTNPDFVYWTNSVDFTANVGGGGEPTPPTTPSQPVPQTLSGGGGAPSILTTDLRPSATSTAGAGVAASVSAGVATPVSATVTRVTSTSPSVIQTQATDLKTAFDSKGSGTSPITVVNTPTGANIFGLIKNTLTNQPIGVPAQDVLMVATSTRAILLAAARNNQPARVNPSGVLVVNNGGVLGAAARGFANNTPGELVLLSTPTLLGTFTTDGNGTFAGQALVPAGFPVGDHTAVLVTAGLITSMGLTVEAAASSSGSDSGWSAPVTTTAEVVTMTKVARFNNFAADSAKLTARAKLWISKNTRLFKEVNSVVCTGFTSGVKTTAATRKLAQDRATRACNLAKRIAPEATIQVRIKPATGVGPDFRSVRVNITGR